MAPELTPKEIADICIGAGFNDYEPHIYDTIRIGKAIERAIEAERAQMVQSRQDAGSGQLIPGNPKSAADEQGSSGGRAQEGEGRQMAVTETKWTPRPWIIGKTMPEASYSSEQFLPPGWQQITGQFPPFALGRSVAHVAETPDAALISAAPDMYEALSELVNRYAGMINSGDCGFWDPETETEVIKARAALRKARGET